MDDGDIASSYAEEWLEDKLKEHQRNVPTPKEFIEGEEYICECGEPIGEVRAKHGYETCIDCAKWLEEHNRRTKFRGEV